MSLGVLAAGLRPKSTARAERHEVGGEDPCDLGVHAQKQVIFCGSAVCIRSESRIDASSMLQVGGDEGAHRCLEQLVHRGLLASCQTFGQLRALCMHASGANKSSLCCKTSLQSGQLVFSDIVTICATCKENCMSRGWPAKVCVFLPCFPADQAPSPVAVPILAVSGSRIAPAKKHPRPPSAQLHSQPHPKPPRIFFSRCAN